MWTLLLWRVEIWIFQVSSWKWAYIITVYIHNIKITRNKASKNAKKKNRCWTPIGCTGQFVINLKFWDNQLHAMDFIDSSPPKNSGGLLLVRNGVSALYMGLPGVISSLPMGPYLQLVGAHLAQLIFSNGLSSDEFWHCWTINGINNLSFHVFFECAPEN